MPIWFQLGGQELFNSTQVVFENRSKIDQNSVKKTLINQVRFWMHLGGLLERFWVNLGAILGAKMASKSIPIVLKSCSKRDYKRSRQREGNRNENETLLRLAGRGVQTPGDGVEGGGNASPGRGWKGLWKVGLAKPPPPRGLVRLNMACNITCVTD